LPSTILDVDVVTSSMYCCDQISAAIDICKGGKRLDAINDTDLVISSGAYRFVANDIAIPSRCTDAGYVPQVRVLLR
jgi:hypothetical protein